METNYRKVFVTYEEVVEAQRAVDHLLEMGYQSDDISILSRDKDKTEDMKRVDTSLEAEDSSTAAGLKGGMATGAAVGGVGGLLAGLGALVIPGIGPILAAGPLVSALSGAVAGGALGGTIGTLGGALMDAGVSEEEARYVDDRFQEGKIIVYVEADPSRFDDVSRTLNYPSSSAREPIKGHADEMKADPNNYSGSSFDRSRDPKDMRDPEYETVSQEDPLGAQRVDQVPTEDLAKPKPNAPEYESEDPYNEEDYNEVQDVIKEGTVPNTDRSYSNLMAGAARVNPVDPTVATGYTGSESRILDEESTMDNRDKAMYDAEALDHQGKDILHEKDLSDGKDESIKDTKEWLDEKVEDIKDTFDESKRDSVRSYHKEDEK